MILILHHNSKYYFLIDHHCKFQSETFDTFVIVRNVWCSCRVSEWRASSYVKIQLLCTWDHAKEDVWNKAFLLGPTYLFTLQRQFTEKTQLITKTNNGHDRIHSHTHNDNILGALVCAVKMFILDFSPSKLIAECNIIDSIEVFVCNTNLPFLYNFDIEGC